MHLEVLVAQRGGVSSPGSGRLPPGQDETPLCLLLAAAGLNRLEMQPCCEGGMTRKSAGCQITRLLLYLQQGVGHTPAHFLSSCALADFLSDVSDSGDMKR